MSELKHTPATTKNPIIRIETKKGKINGLLMKKSLIVYDITTDNSVEEILAKLFIENAREKNGRLLFSEENLFKMCGDLDCMVSSLYDEFLYFIIKVFFKEEFERELKIDCLTYVFFEKISRDIGVYMTTRYTKNKNRDTKKNKSINNLYKEYQKTKKLFYEINNMVIRNIFREKIKTHLDNYGEIQRNLNELKFSNISCSK